MFDIRDATPECYSLILSSWLKRFRDAVHPKMVTDAVFYRIQHNVITKILSQPGLIAKVACNPEDSNHIYGYVIAEQLPNLKMIHWVYVKRDYRRFGVAKKLVESVLTSSDNLVHYSHKTALVKYLDKQEQAKFNPYYVYFLL